MFALCHQLPHRSFLWLWDPPWLCARCTGFYLAILLAFAVFFPWPQWAKSRGLHVAALGIMAAAVIGLEKILDIDVGNWGRFATAVPLGFAVGLGLTMPIVSRKFQEEMK